MDDTPSEKPKIKAKDNPWFLLATIYGQPEKNDEDLKARNRTAWNRYMAAMLTDEQRASCIEKGLPNAEGLTPFSSEELIAVEKAYSERHRQAGSTASAELASPESIDFSHVEFDDHFWAAGFFFPSETTVFQGATFVGDVIFEVATFAGVADFHGAIFSGDAHFEGATFVSNAAFQSATFSGSAIFENAIFVGLALFPGATFVGDAIFEGATFAGITHISGAIFSKYAHFERATFSGEAYFAGTTFSNHAHFERATFSGEAWFEGATFASVAFFTRTTFSGEAYFAGTTFVGGAYFDSTTFAGKVAFQRATFCDNAVFQRATFSGNAVFKGAEFCGGAAFQAATFSGSVSFVNVDMKDQTSFEYANFSLSPPIFFGAKLHEGTVWRGVTWPDLPQDTRKAGTFVDAYERLKLEMDKLKKHEDELDFFALELQSRRALHGDWRSVSELTCFRRAIPIPSLKMPEIAITTKPRKLFSRSFALPHFTIQARTTTLHSPAPGLPIALYGILSDYGRSYVQPLNGLFITAFAGILPFWLYFGLFKLETAIGFSVASTFGVLNFRKDFIDPDVLVSLPGWIKVISAVQTVAGIVLLFLLGLAIRNRFRLK